ncbi:MAG: TIGR03118 family protein [Chitinophagaceae bacterium]
MKKFMNRKTFGLTGPACIALFAFLSFTIACRKNDVKKQLKDFSQVNLVDNNGEYGAPNQDAKQMNAWGLSWSPTGTAWVNSQSGHVSALYNAEGVAPRAAVDIPSPTDTIGGSPTGTVFNGTTGFVLSNGTAARFLFVGTDGVLSGWNGGNRALLIKDNSATSAYTGMAIGSSGGANYIYAADFRGGKIDTWDSLFNPVSFSFMDPSLPSGYSPFNIQNIGNWLYVTYAKPGADGRDVKGVGNGVVSIFNMDGSFVSRFATGDQLNSPWGVAKAPAGFFDQQDDDMRMDNSTAKYGEHFVDSTTVLIGNFGDGKINAYGEHGNFLGQLKAHGNTIVIDGLWALSFAPTTATSIDPQRLYFTAGPDEEKDGLFGYLIKK